MALLQQEVTSPTAAHVKEVSKVILRAQRYREGVGLYYRLVSFPLRVIVLGDAGSNTKYSNYYREGCIVGVGHDPYSKDRATIEIKHTTSDLAVLQDGFHALGSFGRKAKIISWSTSQGEALAAVGSQELGQLIASRLTEVLIARPVSLYVMTEMWSSGDHFIPVDHVTDCNDFFETVTGEKLLPQDRGRLYIAAFREMRISCNIRVFILAPTNSMLADALTKAMTSPQLMKLLSCGLLEWHNNAKHSITVRNLFRKKGECTDRNQLNIKDFEKVDGAGHQKRPAHPLT